MESEKRIFTFAFEGMHRAGKSTQIDLLKNKLSELGIPSISIRGEGYRTGTGDTDSNPESDYWQKMTKILQDPDDYEAWNEASYRLARELIVWRDRVLSRKINETLQPFGVLLVDRSLISNAFLKKLHTKPSPEKIFTTDDLYPKHLQNRKKISADMVLPDMIIELLAPKDVLLSRLKKDDPDYSFRKKTLMKNMTCI